MKQTGSTGHIGHLLALALAFWLALFASPAVAQIVPVPELKSRVTDLAGLLQPAQAAALEQKLAALEKRKGSQVAILIVPTTGDEPIEPFALKVAEKWQLGRGEVDGQAVDDGVLLLIATRDRKIRLEVGYGLEGAIPDAFAKRIISDQISPAFRQGNYAGGLDAAVTSVTALIDGEALPAPARQQRSNSSQGEDRFVPVFIGFVVGMMAIGIVGRLLGTLAGAGATALAAFVLIGGGLFVLLSAIGTAILLSVFGGRARMKRVGRHTYRSGTPIIFPGGFGGGGGGGFGGGFGGGGGGFGGGGASGGW